MQRWQWRIFLLMVFCWALPAVAGAPTPTAPQSVDLRDLMTVTQFDRAGLNKLSPAELKSLNAWLNGYLRGRGALPAQQAPQAASVAAFGAETLRAQSSGGVPNRIETRIAGLFTGWTGNTLFPLENGQIWQQAAPGYFTDVKLDHPQVVIKKLRFGYLLTLPGHGETVFVRRVK